MVPRYHQNHDTMKPFSRKVVINLLFYINFSVFSYSIALTTLGLHPAFSSAATIWFL